MRPRYTSFISVPARQDTQLAVSSASSCGISSIFTRVGHHEPAARLEDAVRLLEHQVLVRREVDDAVGYERVGGVVFERRVLHLRQVELDV